MQVSATDYEESELFTLEVEVVSNAVDNPPSFDRSSYAFSVREDAENGVVIGDIGATDDSKMT